MMSTMSKSLHANLRPARPADLPAIVALLRDCGLPPEGADVHLGDFVVVPEGDALAGCGGVELYGDVALLRSVAVAPAARGRGIGSAIVRRLVDDAAEADVEHLYLLATAAADWFAGLGFEPADRAAAPAELQESAQFTGACPADARLLRQTLR